MAEASRKTRQREAIRTAIAKAHAPVGPREILEAASSDVEGLGLATVYRTLKLMTEAGEINAVDIPGGSPRYEVSGKPHHHHFLCRTCDKVFELEGCCGHFEELTPRGFSVEHHDLTLFGTCASCAGKGSPRGQQTHVHGPSCDHDHAGATSTSARQSSSKDHPSARKP